MISIIIPLYNKEAIVEQSIRSVLSQSYSDFELIVINDGSTDRSAEIVRSIQDPRIRLIEQENGGPSKARNTGVEYSQGEWVVFLDADDELLPNALNSYAELAKGHSDADIIDCGQSIKVGNKLTYMNHPLEGYSKNALRDWYYRIISPGSNHSLFRASLVKKYPYNPTIRRFEDADLLIRLLESAKVYSSVEVTSLVHCDFSSASSARQDIKEDYLGHLDFSGNFWKRMCVYRTFIEERLNYEEQCKLLYPSLYYRKDILLFHKLLSNLGFLF